MNQTRMTTRQVLELMAREHARLTAAIDALGEGTSSVAVTGEGWTAKDVLAHLIHYAGQVAFGLGAQVQPPAYVAGVNARLSGEEWNARAVAHYHAASVAAVREEFERQVALLLEHASFRTDDEMNATDAIPWAGERPLWQIIGGDTFLHWPVHSEAIEHVVQRK
jgi:hypothetical protein